MENPDDVVSPFVWLDDDGVWNDLLAMVFSGSAWPEGSETAVWDLAQEWADLAQGIADASDQLQTAAADLLAGWDAPASGTFDDLARQLLGSPDVGLPGHLQNASAIARQVDGFGVDLQYAKVSVNIAVAVAATSVVIALIAAPIGGLSLTTLGPAGQLGRQAVLRALERLATAAGRRAIVHEIGEAVVDAAVAGAQRVVTTTAGHHLAHEIAEEVVEELVIDVGTQSHQLSEGTRTDWNGLSTVMSAVGGGVGGAVGAGVVAPAVTRLRSTAGITALAGLGADGRRLARTGNAGVRLGGRLAATASTNAVASPAGGIAASLLTGQGFPALDGSTFGMAALAALGRYGTVSPTNPAVLSAAVHPVESLARVHLDALVGYAGQRARAAAGSPAGVPSRASDGYAAYDPVPDGATSPPASARTAAAAASSPVTSGVAPASTAFGQATPGSTAAGTDAPGPTAATGRTAPQAVAPPQTAPVTAAPGQPASETAAQGAESGGAAVSSRSEGDPAPGPVDPGRGGPAATTVDRPGADAPGAPAPTDAIGPGRPGPSDAARWTPGSGAETRTTAGALADASPYGAPPPGSVVRAGGPAQTLSFTATEPSPAPARHVSSIDALPPIAQDLDAAGPVPAPAASAAAGSTVGGPQDGSPGSAPDTPGPHPPTDPAAASGPSDDPPGPPPSAERALYDGMPEALRRYLVEAVAHGQVWADLVQDQLAEVVVHLAERGLPAAEAVGLANAVKSVASAARKIQPAIQGGSTFASTIWSMDDLVRFSLQIDPARYGESVLEALDVFRALGWAVPSVPGPGETHEDWRNTWAIGNRHHGLLVVMTHVETGQRVELQFPTPQSWAVGKRTHKLYEFLRVKSNDNVERVVALARIRDIVRAENVEGRAMQGLDKLGRFKKNGAVEVFAKEPALAADFLTRTVDEAGSAVAALLARGISSQTAEEIVAAALKLINEDTRAEDGLQNEEPATPGLGNLGPSASPPPSELGELGSRDEGSGPTGASGVPAPPGGPRSRAPRPSGAAPGRGARAGEGLRLPDRDLAQARDEADPREPLGGGRRPGDDAVRRSERDVDLGPDERQRDRAPGGRGPLRPAGAGDPGGSRSPGPAEGDDAADPGTPAGDVPQPGGPRAGHVGDPGGPGEAPRPAALTGPLAVGADTALALEHVLAETRADVLWEGVDGTLPVRVLLLADGSTVRISTGPNPWARTDPDRPLQMWTVGAVHLDDGPLTPAASAFLGDLVTALTEIDGARPSSHWLAQRATLDPRTHRITEPGVARPVAAGSAVLVWDAAQGWVEAPRAGGLAQVVDEGLVTAAEFAGWADAADVVAGASHVAELIRGTEAAEARTDHHGTRARRRAELRWAGEMWVGTSVAPTLAAHLDRAVRVLAVSDDRQLVELDDGRLAVVTVAGAENDALSGSRPGLQQAGTTADIGRLRNELADRGGHDRAVLQLTRQLQLGMVRHFRVQGVLAADGFVGMRVTEFGVTRPAHDEPGVLRTRVEPHRHVDPGLSAREAVQRAVTGWTPTSVTEAIANALRWLPFVNPHHDRYPVTARMPWSNNCGDCSRAVADLLHGRDARAAFGDNGARVLDDHRIWGTGPGELDEMWRWADVRPAWHSWQGEARFTATANDRIEQALSTHPEGTVAVVLVNWADEHGATSGGHWFNAAVTEHGVKWIDGQTAQHGAWPPPYTRPYAGYAVITRSTGADPWVDLGHGNPGDSVHESSR